MNQNQTAFDGNTEIIYSETFNIYENRLSIKPVFDFEIIFSFEEDQNLPESQLKVTGNNEAKTVLITLINFRNSLGVGTTNRLPIITTDDGKSISYSIQVTALGGNSTMKQVTVTFYKVP